MPWLTSIICGSKAPLVWSTKRRWRLRRRMSIMKRHGQCWWFGLPYFIENDRLAYRSIIGCFTFIILSLIVFLSKVMAVSVLFFLAEFLCCCQQSQHWLFPGILCQKVAKVDIKMQLLGQRVTSWTETDSTLRHAWLGSREITSGHSVPPLLQPLHRFDDDVDGNVPEALRGSKNTWLLKA